MEITEVRIKLMEDSEDRLRAFCSITFDQAFVVRDLKIIEGTAAPFVAMPSRKLTGRCGRCGYKNHLRSNYCNQCGTRLRGSNDLKDLESNSNRLYADIAHPINQACRDMIQQVVIREYHMELERAKLPGYASRYDDDYFDTPSSTTSFQPPQPAQTEPRKPHFDSTHQSSSETAQVSGESQIPGEEGFGKGILNKDIAE